MTAKLGSVLGLVLCAACNPFAVEATDPGGAGAAPSGGQVMGSSVMQDTEPQRPVPARSMSKTATGTAMSPVVAVAPTTPPADGAQQSPDSAPAAASGAAEASAPAMTMTTTPAAGVETPADSSAMTAAGSMPATPAEGMTPATEGAMPADGTEGAAGTTDTSSAMEDPSGRSKGTAPKGTAVPEGGMECMNEVCLPLPPLNEMAMSMGFMLSLCCTPEGECGTLANDMPCRVIPDSDPQCPRLDVMGFEIASCCTEDGKCGLNGEALMQKPCGSLEEAIEMFGQFIEFPMPRACTPKATAPAGDMPAGGTPDGGMMP